MLPFLLNVKYLPEIRRMDTVQDGRIDLLCTSSLSGIVCRYYIYIYIAYFSVSTTSVLWTFDSVFRKRKYKNIFTLASQPEVSFWVEGGILHVHFEKSEET